MKRIQILYLALWAMVSGMFVSCVDDKYDLDDVDLTLGTSSDLTLPTSSTGEIVLKNILDLEQDGIVQSVDGEYFLIEDGSANVPDITIDPISIKAPQLNEISTHISVSEQESGARDAEGKTNGEIYPGISHKTYHYTIMPEDQAYYTIKESTGIIPSEVVTLDSVHFVDETTLDARIKIVFDEKHSFINKVHLDNLTLTIPAGLHVAHAEFVHWTDINAADRETVPAIDKDDEKGIIRFTETDESTIVDDDHVIDILITFDKAVAGKGGFTFADNKAKLEGLFKIDGTFRLETRDFKLDETQMNTVMDQGFDAIRPESIAFNGSASFNSDIRVKSFGGKVLTEVGSIAPIKLDDMPDFLNDPEVCLDLANPAFFVKVKNPLPADAKTAIALTSKYDDGTAPVEKTSGELLIPANKEVVFCLACDPATAVVPTEFASLHKIDVKIDSLNKLLMKLPEEIQVEVADVTIETGNMPTPTGKSDVYKVGVDYKVYTPLEFGKKFMLVYQGTEEGLSDDLADLDKLDTKEIRIEAKAVTDFPLNLTLSVDAQDRYSNSLKGELVTADDVVIAGHKGDAAYSEQDVTLTVKPVAGHTIGELLQRLDKFHYRAVADAEGAEGKLVENSFLKLKDIRITLVGGISYDAN